MSRAKRADAEGDLVRPLTPAESNDYRAPRGTPPRVGTSVTLWRLDGQWSVWSEGPEVGTWWLRPLDASATALGAALEVKPSRGFPVVTRTWKGAVVVRSRDIRHPGWGA